jgi:8-oxo-dGTP diphosphatase
MKNYCIGFIFDSSLENMLMLKRLKKPFRGKLNGVGGKIEKGETRDQAMLREFLEETPIDKNEIDKMMFARTMILADNTKLEIYNIVLKKNVFAGEFKYTREGLLKWCNIEHSNFLDVKNKSLAGHGDVAYSINEFQENKKYYSNRAIDLNKLTETKEEEHNAFQVTSYAIN